MIGVTKSIIGGSVILQSARGEIYEEDKRSDIDIYVSTENKNIMFNYCRDDGYSYRLDDEGGHEDEISYRGDEYMGYTSKHISHFRKRIQPQSGLKVDVVVMGEELSTSHMRSNVNMFSFKNSAS